MIIHKVKLNRGRLSFGFSSNTRLGQPATTTIEDANLMLSALFNTFFAILFFAVLFRIIVVILVNAKILN